MMNSSANAEKVLNLQTFHLRHYVFSLGNSGIQAESRAMAQFLIYEFTPLYGHYLVKL